jgi:uncharacterized membrane protein
MVKKFFLDILDSDPNIKDETPTCLGLFNVHTVEYNNISAGGESKLLIIVKMYKDVSTEESFINLPKILSCKGIKHFAYGDNMVQICVRKVVSIKFETITETTSIAVSQEASSLLTDTEVVSVKIQGDE